MKLIFILALAVVCYIFITEAVPVLAEENIADGSAVLKKRETTGMTDEEEIAFLQGQLKKTEGYLETVKNQPKYKDDPEAFKNEKSKYERHRKFTEGRIAWLEAQVKAKANAN